MIFPYMHPLWMPTQGKTKNDNRHHTKKGPGRKPSVQHNKRRYYR